LESVAFDLDRYLVPKALVLHAVALGLLVLRVPGRLRGGWGAPEWLFAAFLAAGAVSALTATNLWLALNAWGIGLSSFVLFLACRELSESYRWPLLAALLAATVLGAALGIAQAYGAGWSWM